MSVRWDQPTVTPFDGVGLYEVFFLAASGAVTLLALAAHVVGRQIGHRQALVGMVALVGSFTFAGAFGGLPLSAAPVPVALTWAFLFLPTGVGWGVARLAGDHPPERVARVFPGAWMAALVAALVTQAAGVDLAELVAGTPGLFGLPGFVGFCAYVAAVGVVAGGCCLALLHGNRATGVIAGFSTR